MYNSKPIPCAVWKERLMATCPDDLPAIEKDAFTMHIASCPACAAVVASDYRTDDLIRNALLAEHSPELWKGLLSSISQLSPVNEILSDELFNEKLFRSFNRFDEQDEI